MKIRMLINVDVAPHGLMRTGSVNEVDPDLGARFIQSKYAVAAEVVVKDAAPPKKKSKKTAAAKKPEPTEGD